MCVQSLSVSFALLDSFNKDYYFFLFPPFLSFNPLRNCPEAFFGKGKGLVSAGDKRNNVQGIHKNNDVICVQHKGDCSCFALLLLFHITLSKEAVSSNYKCTILRLSTSLFPVL